MADPLYNDTFREFDTRTSAPAGTGLEDNRGNSVTYQPPMEDPILKGEMNLDRQLPEAGSSRLNRGAEQVGSALGHAVSQARRAQDSARRGLYLVRNRAQGASGSAATQISSSTSAIFDSAQQRAGELAENTQNLAREMADKAQRRGRELLDLAEEQGRVLLDKADGIGQQVAERTSAIREQLDERTRELRFRARLRADEARLRGRRFIDERPLETLGYIAGAAFLLGVSLRIVRSRNARRH